MPIRFFHLSLGKWSMVLTVSRYSPGLGLSWCYESGLVVYAFGDRKTPKPFVSARDKFVYFENLNVTPVDQAAQAAIATSLAAALRLAVEAASDEDGWANLAEVGGLSTKRHPDFDPRTYGYVKFREPVATSNKSLRSMGLSRRFYI
ncbi:hypothetical protein B0H63DRAFT_449521 [Podospora didyma]|uniref:HTH OST-type domain-containing protein n=1 Tax=Podospora didyma TaxID=330526 RepID=A0AAE0NPV5_9PEZI|nr:hypothetical protein B0H63DRAFT_449521 [Podospora didyma]